MKLPIMSTIQSRIHYYSIYGGIKFPVCRCCFFTTTGFKRRYKFSSFPMSSMVDIQDLVDCFDDIPDLMKTMHKLTKSCPSIHPGEILYQYK